MNGDPNTNEDKKQRLREKLLALKKSRNAAVVRAKKATSKQQKAEDKPPSRAPKQALAADEIDGEAQSEDFADNEMDIEEPNPERQKRPKHLLKHFTVDQSLDSFFTGGTLHFCTDKSLVYAQRDSSVVRFNLQSKEVEFEISHNEEDIANFAVNPKDSHIATFTKNSMLRYIKIEEKRIVHSQKCMGFFASDMLFDKSGALLVLGDPRGVIHIFELRTFKIVQQYKAHAGGLLGMHLVSTRDIFNLYTFGRDRGVLVYDIKQAEAVKKFERDAVSFTALGVEEDGSLIAAAGFDGLIHCWQSEPKQKYLGALQAGTEITVIQIFTFSLKKENEKKKLLLAGTEKGFVRIWTLNEKSIADSPSFDILEKNKHEIRAIQILRDEKKIVVINLQRDLYIFGLKGYKEQRANLQIEEEVAGCNDLVLDVKFIKMAEPEDPRNNLLVIASNSETLRIFDLDKKRNLFVEGHSDMILTLDTRQEFVMSGSKDTTIKLWKIENQPSTHFNFSCRLLCTFRGHQLPVISLSLNPKDGSYFLSGSEDKTVKKWILPVEVYSCQTPKMMKQAKRTAVAHEKQVNVVRIAPGGKVCASASHDKKIVIYDARDMSQKFAFKAHKRGVWDMAFSPYEKVLASVSGDRIIKVWSIEDGSLLHSLEGHVAAVLKVSWATLGSQLISASADGLVKVWAYKKGLCMNSFEGHEGRVWALDFCEKEDGAYLATGDNGHKLLVWKDCTLEESSRETAENQMRLVQLHQVESLVSAGMFEEAIKKAFDLGLVRGLIRAFEAFLSHFSYVTESIYSVIDAEDVLLDKDALAAKDRQAEDILTRCVQYFLDTDATRFLVFVRDINTKNRYFQISNRLLFALVKLYDLNKVPELHDKFVNSEKKLRLEDIIGVINVYSHKHFERMREYLQKCCFLEYLVSKVGFLARSSTAGQLDEQGQTVD